MSQDLRQLTLLILSDIHFGPDSCSKDFSNEDNPPKHLVIPSTSMKDSLIEIINKQHKQLDGIIVTGDLTSKGKPSELKGCFEKIIEIAKQVCVDNDNIFFTFGNHDIDWEISKLAELEKPVCDALYLEVAASFCQIYVSNRNCSSPGPVPGSGLFKRDKFEIYIVNSAYFSTHNQSYSHGKLGEKQFQWLSSVMAPMIDSGKWKIFILHHHPFKYSYPSVVEDISCLEEGSDLCDLLGKNNIDIVCHGHRHHPQMYTKMRSGWVSPITFFCAGSLSVNETERRLGEIHNVFHVLSLETRDSNHAAIGTITTYRYSTANGWIQSEASDMIPLDPVQKFGAIETLIEKESEITNIIKSLLNSRSDIHIDMPQYNSLPLCLLCTPIKELNALFKKGAIKHNTKIVGEYPNVVLLKRL